MTSHSSLDEIAKQLGQQNVKAWFKPHRLFDRVQWTVC